MKEEKKMICPYCVICPYCGKRPEFVDNKEIYGKRYGKSYMAYWCRDCDAMVGTHNNTKKPLGTMANKELRGLRMKCHALFDPLWKSGKMHRKKAYSYLFKNTGVKHIGQSSKEECEKIINLLTPSPNYYGEEKRKQETKNR